MSTNEVKTPLREVRLRVAAAFTLIFLSSDSLNPVKIICSIIGIDSRWVALFSAITFLVIIAGNAKELTYFMVKTFFHSVLSIFFSSMEVIGKQNIPPHGPVIFTGNHMNQFIDGAVIVISTPRPVGFLVAEKSMKKRIIGDFAKACGGIPVSRPQDKAKPGVGRIYFDQLRLVGEGTRFTEIQKGEKIRPGCTAEMYKLKEVLSDTEALLADDYGEASPLHEKCQGIDNWTSFDVLPAVDQTGMFEHVHASLANGKCLGIFPEGGSHDRTDLLPLKAGVAAIAFGAHEKYDISVPIVPVGLTYFRGHHFRGRVVVEFGQPIHLTKDTLKVYSDSKRKGYQTLLQQVEAGMRSVLVTAPDYAELKLIHTVRRLYQRNASTMSTKKKQDLARRFSVAHRVLKEKFSDHVGAGVGADQSTKGSFVGFPEDIQLLAQKVEAYQEQLDHWGLRDYQLQHTHLQLSYSKLWYLFLHGAVVLFLASFPSLILNAPVGIAANYFAYREAKKDLKASRVKLAARDVLLSKKVIFCLVAVPVLWVSYALLLFLFSPLETRTIVVLFLSCPFFSYIGVMGVQGVMLDLKDLRPAFLRLLPSFQQHAVSLPKERVQLQKEVRAMVKKYGPSLGRIYSDPLGTDDWDVPHHAPTISSGDTTDRGLSSVSDSGTAVSTNLTERTATGPDGRTISDEQMQRVASLDVLASALATTLRADEEDYNYQQLQQHEEGDSSTGAKKQV